MENTRRFAIIFVLFLINNISCKDVKDSVNPGKEHPLSRLLLNKIQKFDTTVEKLQDEQKELQKNILAVEEKLLEKGKGTSLKTVAIEPVLQLSFKTTSVFNPEEVGTVQKSLDAFKASSESHFKVLEKKIQQQENETISKTESIERQISQLSSQIRNVNNSNEVETITKMIDVLKAVARTHLTADDLVSANKDLNNLKVKVLDLEQQLKSLDEKECPESWKKLDESCYYFGKDNLDWYASKDRCIKLGGQLVKLGSNEESQMLLTEAKKLGSHGSFWMGANDISREGTWVWADKSRVQLTMWNPGEPNNSGDQDCGKLYTANDFRWDDYQCSHKGQYICEKEK